MCYIFIRGLCLVVQNFDQLQVNTHSNKRMDRLDCVWDYLHCLDSLRECVDCVNYLANSLDCV